MKEKKKTPEFENICMYVRTKYVGILCPVLRRGYWACGLHPYHHEDTTTTNPISILARSKYQYLSQCWTDGSINQKNESIQTSDQPRSFMQSAHATLRAHPALSALRVIRSMLNLLACPFFSFPAVAAVAFFYIPNGNACYPYSAVAVWFVCM